MISKSDSGLLVRVIPTLAYMMEDKSTIVVKKLLASVIQIYRLALMVSVSVHSDNKIVILAPPTCPSPSST